MQEAQGEVELVYPSISIRAEPHVAVVDKNVDRHKSREATEADLKYLFIDEAQEIIAKHFYRPINEAILKLIFKLFPITAIAKDFLDAHKQLISEGRVLDKIYKAT